MNIVIPVRFSFVNVFEPRAINEGDDPKYGASLLIPKSDKKTIKIIEDAIKAEYTEKKASHLKNKPLASIKTTFKDGDELDEPNEDYDGHMYLNANNKSQPGIVDAKRQPIIDEDEFYSGCYGYASVTIKAYNVDKSFGITAYLNHVMKTKDGENLSGRVSAEKAFEGIEIPEDEVDVDEFG